jgi:hypothetical protein
MRDDQTKTETADVNVSKADGSPRIGEFWVDYSQPRRTEIDTIENSCAALFKESKPISVHRET